MSYTIPIIKNLYLKCDDNIEGHELELVDSDTSCNSQITEVKLKFNLKEEIQSNLVGQYELSHEILITIIYYASYEGLTDDYNYDLDDHNVEVKLDSRFDTRDHEIELKELVEDNFEFKLVLL